MLRHKSLQHLHFYVLRLLGCLTFHPRHHGRVFHMHRKVRPVAQMPPTTHHGQVHTRAPALHFDGQDVHVLVGQCVHRLFVQHAGQRRHLVAQLGGLFKFELLGMRHHTCAQCVQHLLCLAAQKLLRTGHVLPIRLGADQVHAGAGAALDLVQQAGPRAIVEHRVLTGAQAEHLLQQQDGFLHPPGIGKRPEVVVALFRRAPVVRHTRKHLRARHPRAGCAAAGDLEVGVTLVIPEQDVVLRVLRLDEVVFQQQRLGLGAHHRGLHPHDLADHVADTRAAMGLLEVVGHPLLEVACLAHIQQLAVRIKVAVHPRQRGQGRHFTQ